MGYLFNIEEPRIKLSFYCEVLEINVNQEKTTRIDDLKFWLVKDDPIHG